MRFITGLAHEESSAANKIVRAYPTGEQGRPLAACPAGNRCRAGAGAADRGLGSSGEQPGRQHRLPSGPATANPNRSGGQRP
jgi:hypothetical protein